MGSVHGFSQSHGRRDSWMNLTEAERRAIEGTERLGASLSLLAIILVVVTYSLFKRLRTVPNTFILFASVANVGASVACLIGYSGIEQGDRTSLCQTQAFLLETFMQSDSYWSLAMALNVYLVFFHAKNPNSFRRYLWVYCVCCYGIPMLLAVSLLAYSYHNLGDPSQSPVYGNATVSWVSSFGCSAFLGLG